MLAKKLSFPENDRVCTKLAIIISQLVMYLSYNGNSSDAIVEGSIHIFCCNL